jgi:hypothetical protein
VHIRFPQSKEEGGTSFRPSYTASALSGVHRQAQAAKHNYIQSIEKVKLEEFRMAHAAVQFGLAQSIQRSSKISAEAPCSNSRTT